MENKFTQSNIGGSNGDAKDLNSNAKFNSYKNTFLKNVKYFKQKIAHHCLKNTRLVNISQNFPDNSIFYYLSKKKYSNILSIS